MSYIEYYRKVGEYFGYPKCCVDYFCNRENENDITTHQLAAVHKMRYTGFIPCQNHAIEILNGTKVKDIIHNRICIEKYPRDYSVKTLNDIIEMKNKFLK